MDWRKIQTSPNPYVEYIIQSCIGSWTQSAAKPAAAKAPTKAPVVAPAANPKPADSDSSSSIDGPLWSIFDDDETPDPVPAPASAPESKSFEDGPPNCGFGFDDE